MKILTACFLTLVLTVMPVSVMEAEACGMLIACLGIAKIKYEIAKYLCVADWEDTGTQGVQDCLNEALQEYESDKATCCNEAIAICQVLFC